MKCKIAITLATLFLLLTALAIVIASAEINNAYQEVNPLVLFDDNAGFWSSGGYGNGTVGVSTASSTSVVKTGNLSLQVNVTTGPYLYVQVGHIYGSNQDWSSYENFCFWFYGSNSNSTVEFALAAPDSYNQLWVTFRDNFTGWAHFVQPLRSMGTIGNTNLSKITQLGFFFFDAPRTFYVDRMILDTAPTPTPTPTSSPIPTPTPEPTPSPTLTPTPSPTSVLPTPTPTPTPIPTPTPNETPTPTPEPTNPTPTTSTPTPTNPTPTLSPSSSPSPTTSPSPSPTPSPSSTDAAVAAAVTTTSAGVVAVGIFAAGTALAANAGEAFSSAISKLPLPRQLLELFGALGEEVFKTVGEKEIKAKKKAPFINKAELIALTASVLIMIFVYSFADAGGLNRFLNLEVLAEVLPIVCLTVLIARITAMFSDAITAKICNLQKKFCLWPSGVVAILVSGLLFLFPFAIPWITRYEGLNLSPKSKALMMLLKTLILLILALPFAVLIMVGAEEIGNSGLLIVFAWTAAALIPLKPMAGKFIFNYKKSLSALALALIIILLYGFTLAFFEPVVYLTAGIISVILTATTLVFLKKSLKKTTTKKTKI